ncbi:MAG: DnaD domain protein [Bacilli bacterium]|nr:DnaD domain protein [Bacilli bacterium]
MNAKIIELLKDSTISFPRILLTHYQSLKITEKELIFLIYLIGEDSLFNPKKISTDLHISLGETLECIASLSGKDLLKIEVMKVGNSREERILLDGLYHKLAFYVVNTETKEEEKTNLFDLFEKEFGRTLSPIEYEIIKGWRENEFTEELILLALKEAVYNGVFRLNYIDKILFEWRKKGIKNKEDVEKNNRAFNVRKKETKEEVFEYDWLSESE